MQRNLVSDFPIHCTSSWVEQLYHNDRNLAKNNIMTLTLAPKVNISQLTNMMKNLLDLLDLDTEDEYGILRPNDYAFKMAMNLIIDTYTMMGDEFPQGSSSTDDQGGIRIN